MKKITALILLGLALLLVVSSVSGQTGGGYDLTWNAIPSGGQTFSTGSSYILGSGPAQPVASAPMTGGTYSLAGGFWVHAHSLQLFMPLVKK